MSRARVAGEVAAAHNRLPAPVVERLSAEPGAPVVATKDGATIMPFGLMTRLAQDKDAVAEWQATSARLGLGALSLAPPDA
jgi:hypothetical protein